MTAPVEQQAGKSIPMTAPVEQQAGKSIQMTAPVEQAESSHMSWKINFIMPKKYTMKTIPKPNNKAVILKAVPAKRFVVIRFSGTASKKNLEKNLKNLKQYIKDHQIKTIGEPKYAFYNPPWTLPFLRRNEIMFQIK